MQMSSSEFVSPDTLLDLGFCSPRVGALFQLFILLFTDILLIFHIQIYFLHLCNSIGINLYRMWEVLYKNFETLKKLNTFFFLFIDPLYLSQPELIQKRCFVHYLDIPGVSRRMDTSICQIWDFFKKKSLWAMFLLFYFIE